MAICYHFNSIDVESGVTGEGHRGKRMVRKSEEGEQEANRESRIEYKEERTDRFYFLY